MDISSCRKEIFFSGLIVFNLKIENLEKSDDVSTNGKIVKNKKATEKNRQHDAT